MNNFLKFNNKLEEFYNIDYNFHIFSFLFLSFQQLAYLQIPTFLLSSPSIGKNIRLNAGNYTVPAFQRLTGSQPVSKQEHRKQLTIIIKITCLKSSWAFVYWGIYVGSSSLASVRFQTHPEAHAYIFPAYFV